jgi:lipopolysaccharide export system protein LptC
MRSAGKERAASAPGSNVRARLLPPARAELAAGSRYSRFVKTAKILLPSVAIALLLVVVIASALHKSASDITASLSELKLVSGHLGMSKPTLTYTDAQSRSFLVNADRATQVAGSNDIWQLERIKGRMTPPQGVGYRLVSNTGLLDSAHKLLDLSGSVLVVSDQGYSFEARSAHVDMSENRVTSKEPVRAKGGATSVSSDQFEMWDKGNKLRFEGRVHFVSEAAPRKNAGAPKAGTAK